MAKLNNIRTNNFILLFGIAIILPYSNNLIEGYDDDDNNCNKYPTKQEDCLNTPLVKGLNQNNAICDDFDDNGRTCKSRYDTYNSDDKLKLLAKNKTPITNNDWEWHKPIRIKMAKDYTETKYDKTICKCQNINFVQQIKAVEILDLILLKMLNQKMIRV